MFMVILMLFALQNDMPVIAVALLLVAVVTAIKGKGILLLAALLAVGLLVAVFIGLGDATGQLVIAGLFVIFLITLANDKGQPAYGPGM